jgi:hypothetical protein
MNNFSIRVLKMEKVVMEGIVLAVNLFKHPQN